ncbi:concanavalin A-like lectin/glucanase domain-containing protein [Paraphysoderma sedebokerense]|nr:concanavalin A-like lectin/glucanase domain-containing protein [Paraphysoderma sedebokerense]
MRNVTLLALFLTLCTVTAAVKCPNAKTECPQSAPCCNRHGYCSATPMDCYVEQGCQANASYTGACVSINPGCKSFREDFNDGSAVKKRDEYDGDPDKTRFIDEFDTVRVSDGFLHLTHSYDATLGQGKISRLFSTRWFRYGRISASLKTGLAPGLVNSFIYDSSADSDHVGDEIDYEWVYKDRTETQTNYYIDGIVDYTRGVPSYFKDPTTGTAQSTTDETFHLYEIEWLPNSISWIIDGKPVRTVTRNGTDAFPDDFGKLFMSIWDNYILIFKLLARGQAILTRTLFQFH